MTMPPNHADFTRGLDLFNRAHFFDAHEVLEDVWRALPRDRPSRRRRRLHLQGLIQVAVAFHHQSTGNHVGALSVLKRAMRNLSGADSSFPNLDLDRLLAELDVWRRYLDESENGRDDARNNARDDARDDARNHGRDPGRHTAPALPKILLRG